MTIRRRDFTRYGKTYHSYFDGDAKIPGVTTILDNGLPKPALIDWAARATAEYAVDHWDELGDASPSARLKTLNGARWETKNAAAVRGTQIHGYAELIGRGEEAKVPPEHLGPAQAYARLLDEFGIRVQMTELTVVNRRHRYAGTLDLLASVVSHGGGRWLIDVKSGKAVYADVALQLAMYRYAEHYLGPDGQEYPMPNVDQCGVIHILPDDARLIPVEAGPEVFRQALYVAQVARWPELSEGLIGQALTPPNRPGLEVVR